MDIENVHNFDYFILTVIYPTSVCRTDNEHGKFIVQKTNSDFCKVPVNASPWTIHGLWPSRNDGSFPQFCDKSIKFNLSKLLPIQQKLEINWPNLLTKQSISSLWKHEWEKHGTCAATVEEVNNEVKYFNKTLALHEQFDVFSVLRKLEIMPSEEKVYDWLSLHLSLKSAYGENIEFHCLQDKETKKWLLADVRLCLTKNFQLMNCKERQRKWKSSERSLLPTYHRCPANGIIYPPINSHSIDNNDIITLVLFSVLFSLWK